MSNSQSNLDLDIDDSMPGSPNILNVTGQSSPSAPPSPAQSEPSAATALTNQMEAVAASSMALSVTSMSPPPTDANSLSDKLDCDDDLDFQPDVKVDNKPFVKRKYETTTTTCCPSMYGCNLIITTTSSFKQPRWVNMSSLPLLI